jgi:hypothetical protein
VALKSNVPEVRHVPLQFPFTKNEKFSRPLPCFSTESYLIVVNERRFTVDVFHLDAVGILKVPSRISLASRRDLNSVRTHGCRVVAISNRVARNNGLKAPLLPSSFVA